MLRKLANLRNKWKVNKNCTFPSSTLLKLFVWNVIWFSSNCNATALLLPGKFISVARNTMSSPCNVVIDLWTCIRCAITCKFKLMKMNAWETAYEPVLGNLATCSWLPGRGRSMVWTHKSPRAQSSPCVAEWPCSLRSCTCRGTLPCWQPEIITC